MERPDVLIVAAEPSGDQLAAGLADALMSRSPGLSLVGIGGDKLASEGIHSLMDIEGLAILGFVEGLKAYPFVLKKVREASDIILKHNPSSVVLIDSWGFMVRVAKRLKSKGYEGTIIKYVAPQVWAMRSGRAKILAKYVDHLLSTQPMDKPFFDAVGLPQTYVGNAVFDQDYGSGNGKALRSELGLDATTPLIGLFVGSRPSEIETVAPAILQARDNLKALGYAHDALCIIAKPVESQVSALLKDIDIHCVPQSRLLDALAAIDGAFACSGTITTQLASAGVPTVVLYRLSAITYAIGSRIMKPDYISLVNIAADRPLMPEFMQSDLDTDKPATALFDILSNSKRNRQVSDALKDQTRRMGAGQKGASQKAADAVLKLIEA